jgi:cell division protein FtsN
MPSLKKGVLYGILFFVVVWMFVLGIFVGRGSAPVKFDTREFQKKLANISGQYEAENKNAEETEIQFYEDLQTPMPGAVAVPEKTSSVTRRIETEDQTAENDNTAGQKKIIPLKISRKNMTKAKYAASSTRPAKSATVTKRIVEAKKEIKAPPVKNTKHEYTIQIAAFKDLKSAFDKVSVLKAKGYAAYRTIGKVQNDTWYRVRVGRFPNTEVARKYLRKLKHDNINGIIIKQDS